MELLLVELHLQRIQVFLEDLNLRTQLQFLLVELMQVGFDGEVLLEDLLVQLVDFLHQLSHSGLLLVLLVQNLFHFPLEVFVFCLQIPDEFYLLLDEFSVFPLVLEDLLRQLGNPLHLFLVELPLAEDLLLWFLLIAGEFLEKVEELLIVVQLLLDLLREDVDHFLVSLVQKLNLLFQLALRCENALVFLSQINQLLAQVFFFYS